MKKKVLYLITKATWGGAQRYVFDLASHLPSERFEPVVAFGERGRLAEILEQKHIRIVQIPSLGRNIALISDCVSFFNILSCIWREHPDIVHLNSSKAAALGTFAARLLGVPKIIFTVHGWPFGEKRNPIAKILIWKISWLTALLSHHVICVSDYDLQSAKLMPLIGRKVVRIYNGIDSNMQFGSGELVRSVFPAGAAITGTIGELTRNKNQWALIEQARKDHAMHIAIVGEGEDRQKLEGLIQAYNLQSRVKLFGFIPAAEVLRGFDTFALPSLKEGLPYVLLEAKAVGLPIVANRVGGVSEILDKPLSDFSLEQMVQKTIALY